MSCEIINTHIEPKEPVYNRTSERENEFYSKGLITRNNDHNSLFLRRERAIIYHQVLEHRKNKDCKSAKKLLDEAKDRQFIFEQYLIQKEIEININNCGKQKSRFVNIKPPKHLDQKKPPIFFIPGIGNDLDRVGSIINEIAFTGRQIICLAQPESFKGKTTNEFTKLVKKSSGYQPHLDYYQQAINKLIPNGDFELYGLSMGGGLSQELLKIPQIYQRITNAVLFSPTNTNRISLFKFISGLIHNTNNINSDILNFPRYNKTFGYKKNRQKIIVSLCLKGTKTQEQWKDLHVKPGGKITIITGDKDHITYGSLLNKEKLKTNPQIEHIIFKNGIHSSPITKPKEFLKQILHHK